MEKLIYTAIIEQTYNYPKRMKYHPEDGTFTAEEYDSLAYVKGFQQPYGWLKETGTPPGPHLDVYVMTDREFALGTELEVYIIGVYWRTDGDHKLVAVLPEREIEDLSQLEPWEKDELKKLYSGKYAGEGWFGRDRAEDVLREAAK